MTAFFKYAVPIVWVVFLGACTSHFALSAATAPFRKLMFVLFPIYIIFGILFLWIVIFPLKHAFIEGQFLRIGDGRNEIPIPGEDIVRIDNSILTNPEIITIYLRKNTIFGRKIKFAVPYRFFRTYPHPLVIQLRNIYMNQTKTPTPTTISTGQFGRGQADNG